MGSYTKAGAKIKWLSAFYGLSYNAISTYRLAFQIDVLQNGLRKKIVEMVKIL